VPSPKSGDVLSFEIPGSEGVEAAMVSGQKYALRVRLGRPAS